MQNIAVFFGGVSPEHDISVITGIQTISALDDKKYNIIPIYVDKNGRMIKGDFFDVKSVSKTHKKKNEITLVLGGIKKNEKIIPIDCAITCFHGGIYEGGGFSSMLESVNIPYTSSGVLASALSMDKNLQKALAEKYGIPTLPYVAIKNRNDIKNVEFPVVVKPNSSGSSIGVSVCNGKNELNKAIDLAYKFDDIVLLEKKAENFFELNISAFKKSDGIMLSAIEKPITKEEILSFSEKYLVGEKHGGMKSLKRECPASISDEIKTTVESYAKILYEKLSLFGIVRFDFIVENDAVYFNEVNVIPGSLAWYLWDAVGISFSSLLDMAIEEGILRYKNSQSKIRIINTDVLK